MIAPLVFVFHQTFASGSGSDLEPEFMGLAGFQMAAQMAEEDPELLSLIVRTMKDSGAWSIEPMPSLYSRIITAYQRFMGINKASSAPPK